MSTITVFPARVAGLYKSRFAQVVVGLLLGIAVGVLTPVVRLRPLLAPSGLPQGVAINAATGSITI
jgi:hypothetical protein